MDYQAIYNEAHEAGIQAGKTVAVVPMTVQHRVDPFNDNSQVEQEWHEPEGACGFAWVKFKGNSGFARWAKSNRLTMPAYPSGMQIWVSEFGQSVQRKEAYAEAFAKVLEKHGIKCFAQSRLD